MYIPKNKISTNNYTKEKEYIYKSDKKPYSGFYWKTFDGKAFTGKSPTHPTSVEIIKIQNPESRPESNYPESSIAIGNYPTPFDSLDENPYNPGIIIEYAKLTNTELINPIHRKLPSHHYPVLDDEDYEKGSFTRYFTIKTNEILVFEVSKEVYDKIKNKSQEWVWELYTPFKLDWVIVGERDKVYIINRNVVRLEQKKLKRNGIESFFKSNFSKFWKDLA
jgi:hypothetical protein